jgi:hypothetical protein
MPPQLGDFISQAMYNNQLNSNPLHPITQPACFFVDVAGGKAIQRGTSFIVCTLPFPHMTQADSITEPGGVHCHPQDCLQI